SCENIEVIGSKKDLLSQKFSENKYYLFRHGHSLRQVKGVTSCWPEKPPLPLTKEGKEHVKRQAKKFKSKSIDLIFSSDLLRTKQTAQILADELSVKVIFDKRLREFDAGIFNGKDPKKVWDYVGGADNIFVKKAPKGESFSDLKKRTYQFIKEINKKHQQKNIIIVSHEATLSLLEASLKGLENEEILAWRGKNKLGTGQSKKVEFKALPYNQKMEIDLHRPYIDRVKFHCNKCESLMERVPEVIDCWFDSGAMPFAQAHWPFSQQKKISPPQLFPADYICEAIDQTRGWFYTLLAISTLLGRGPSYKNVISLGHVLDEKGEKMSKSKGNVIDPWYIVEKYGADAARWYFYTINQPGDVKLFREKDIEESLRKFLITFWNCYIFFDTYARKANFEIKSDNVLDKWIISKLNELIEKVTESLNKYDVTFAARLIESFAVEDFSQWYIRRSRKRFQKPETKKELKEASATLGFVLLSLSQLIAPFTPFLGEKIYQQLTSSKKQSAKSVHLASWPKENKKLINKKLNQKMEKVRVIVSQALAERSKKGFKVRQPLNELRINVLELKKAKALLGLIKEEVNVKKITFGKTIKLDTKITLELKKEGVAREIIRQIQVMRKKAGFKPKDKISVRYCGSNDLNEVLSEKRKFVLKETKAKDFKKTEELNESFDVEKEVKFGEKKLWLGIKKV
ncbi:class I tRNA ligase family protein, partial [Patescibacteria group bacterium]